MGSCMKIVVIFVNVYLRSHPFRIGRVPDNNFKYRIGDLL